jgi:3-hydroxyisobutyrate dehydrogenase-like beta-hydroxyacid dehydrogenase
MAKRLAFLGLGVMGYPMAGHLAAKGYDMAVYNRSRPKADAWVAQHGGRATATPAEAARGADIVLLCVGADADVRAVLTGPDGAMATLAPGAIIVDHTTTSATVARDMELAAKERSLHFLDAPLSGGQAGAENGQLTIMVGGDETAYRQIEETIRVYAKQARLMGPVGAGQLTKMVNQICIAGAVQGLAEGIAFAERAGLDPKAVIEVISKGAAQSWQMENRYASMVERRFDFGFAVDWMRKDLGIVLDEGRRNGAKLPVTALVDQFYGDVQSMGGRRYDTSSLLLRLADKK